METPSHEQLLRSLMQTIPDRIYFKDKECRFIMVNPAMLQFFNATSADQVLGKTDFDLFLKEHATAAFEDEKNLMKTGTPIHGKIEREELPDGRIHWSSSSKAPLTNANGEIIGTCGISRDMTKEQLKNEQLRAYAQALAEKQSQIEQELQLAREIQQALLPSKSHSFNTENYPALAPLRFSHRYMPTAFVGGDFFSIFPVSNTEVGVFISDVMGHGVPAALVTSTQRILVHELQGFGDDPGDFLTMINARICETYKRISSPLFITAFYCVINAKSGRVRYANAAHPTPFIRKSGEEKITLFPMDRKVKSLALGMIEDTKYSTGLTQLNPGDWMLMYTDGLSDFDRPDQLKTDEEVCRELVQAHAKHKGDRLLDEIIKDVSNRIDGHSFPDDVCLLSVEIATATTPPPPPPASKKKAQ